MHAIEGKFTGYKRSYPPSEEYLRATGPKMVHAERALYFYQPEQYKVVKANRMALEKQQLGLSPTHKPRKHANISSITIILPGLWAQKVILFSTLYKWLARTCAALYDISLKYTSDVLIERKLSKVQLSWLWFSGKGRHSLHYEKPQNMIFLALISINTVALSLGPVIVQLVLMLT